MNERMTELYFEPLYSRRRKVIDFWPLLTRYVKNTGNIAGQRHWEAKVLSDCVVWCRVFPSFDVFALWSGLVTIGKILRIPFAFLRKKEGGEDSINCLSIKMVLKKKTKQIWSTLSSCALLMVYHQISWWQGIPIERVREWLDQKWAFNLWMILIQSRYLFEELRYFGSQCALPSLRMRFSFAEKVFRNVLAHKI